MATDAGAAVGSADAPSTLPAGDSAPTPTSPGGGASAAAAVVLDKLASLDVARRAERERRREELRAAADPRESISQFLRGFAARQRSVEEAIQRMLQQQPSTSSPAPATPAPSNPPPASTAADADAEPEADAAARVLEVSSATPELVASSLEMLGSEVLSLEQSAAAASYYLPAYDQKQCAGAVAALRAAIEGARTTLAPRKKFAFGSKKVTKVRGEEMSSAAATTTATAAASAADAAAHAAAPVFTHSAAGPAAPSSGTSSANGTGGANTADADAASGLVASEQDRALVARGRGVMGLTDQVVVISQAQLEAEGGGGGGGDFVLLGLTRCTVVLLGRLRALRAAGLRGCTVVAGPVTGACFMDDVRDCTLALATYQVRIHRAHSTDLFLRVRSKPIIEHSAGIRVAPWPALLPGPAAELRLAELLGRHMLGEETGCWQQVEDFGWIKAVQSPNWCVMPEEGRPAAKFDIPAGVWADSPAAAAQERAGQLAAASATWACGATEPGLGADDEL
ncbi:hypothetical protein HXX76_006317 [Chlamydomonas incerta]|uniref:C-CAP/cofactor C-like domain-containing protein n=1 Tax=Chlamydomonas incerta TaxID=51695 RepID=A0A835T0X3_CHLIN|nr:hypothetical protein HXX76_006317 [Chlamydomonas incerta]|eukprot:KAG2436793.1 hypothetical protein HXX76_006317 [Chlamydomonas incerta]